MQIVIDIPDNKYQWIKDNPLTYDSEYCEAIRNGIPLDKIRAEIIENSIEDYKYHGCGSNELIIDASVVLEIIDKYKTESEG